MTKPIQIIMIDNYDSFTYNLVDQFRQLNFKVLVFRNDAPVDKVFSEENLSGHDNLVVLSPGPGTPDSAGNTLSIIEKFADKFPILGICLGHQAIVQQFGGSVGKAKTVVHGKADQIEKKKHPVLKDMDAQFQAARYHSLVATKLPSSLRAIAHTKNPDDREVMAVVHKEYPVVGLQFHPESILTTFGKKLLTNCVDWLINSSNQNQPLNA